MLALYEAIQYSGRIFLYAVSPDGELFSIARWEHDGPHGIVDWSPDGRRALLVYLESNGHGLNGLQNVIREIDLVAGAELPVILTEPFPGPPNPA